LRHEAHDAPPNLLGVVFIGNPAVRGVRADWSDSTRPSSNTDEFVFLRLTARVTGAGAGVENVREQEKLEARKMPANRAESPASSARCVGWRFYYGSVFKA